jgi:hypothetical protein
MADLWPTKLLENLPYPRPTTGWLADPQNAPAWLDDVHLAHFSPLQVAGCALWLDPRVTDGIVLANTSITDGATLNTGWTQTNVTPSYNQDGVGGTQFTVSSTTNPRVTQTPATLAFHVSAQPPCTITVKYKAGTVPFLLLETLAAASHRTWINLATHAVGTLAANHAVTISAPDALGYRTVTLVFSVATSAPTARFQFTSADNVTTGASVGQTIWLKEATVDQPRVGALMNLVSGVSAAQATVNSQLGYEAAGIGGQPAVRAYVAASSIQFLDLTEAAVLNLVSGSDKAHTLFLVVKAQGLASEAGALVSWNAVSPAKYDLVQDSTGAGPLLLSKRGDADGAGLTLTSSYNHSNLTSGAVIEITHTGTVASVSVNGATASSAAQDAGTLTPTTLRLLGRSVFAIGAKYSLGAVVGFSRVLTATERSWVRRGLAVGGSDPYGIAVAA